MSGFEITPGGEEIIPQASGLPGEAFVSDPTINYLLSSIPKDERIRYLPQYFSVLLMSATLNSGTIEGIDDWKSCGSCRVSGELKPLTKVAKAKTFAEGEDHYYIFFLGTHSSARGRGLCSKIIKYYQSIAQQKGKPIWIEAATEYCAKLYERHGFVITQTIILGKGMADKNREFKEGGEGFKILGMVWRPTARQEEVKGQK